jgi:uncharacterized membrane protein YczE
MAAVNLTTVVKQLADHLLLTIPAMLSAKVRIGTVAPAEVDAPSGRSSRDRLRVVASESGA